MLTLPNAVQIPANLNGGTGDAQPGTTAASGSGSVTYPGQVGAIIQLTETMANQLSAASGGFATLHQGMYQYVQFLSTSTQANAAGNVAFWSNRLTKVVTPDATGNLRAVAGIILQANTKGYYGWIQISGVGTVNFKLSATPAAGDLVIVDQSASTVGTADVATSTITGPIEGSLLGTAIAASVGGSPASVDLWAIRQQP
jgi:hypothetical protein